VPDTEIVPLDASPGDRIALAIKKFGERDVADRAAALLRGTNEGEEFLLWVGGRHAQGILDGAPALYWPEVWGARTLLHAWDEPAGAVIRSALANQAWRVREMCCRVVAARELPFGAELLPLLTDEVARVRGNAARALGVVGDYNQALEVKKLLKDPELDVRKQTGAALKVLTERLGRTID
jgi:HEAT repeat protein